MEVTTIHEVPCQEHADLPRLLPYKVPLVLYKGEVTQILCIHLHNAKCLFTDKWCYLVEFPGSIGPLYTGPNAP